MALHIPLITNLVRHFRMFWAYTHARLLVLIGITMVSGFSESFGIALFMPILTATNITVQSSDRVSRFFSACFSLLGIDPSLPVLCGIVALVFTVRGLLRYLESLYTARLTALITSSVRSRMVDRFLGMDYRAYIERDTGYFSNLVITETSRMVISFSRYCAVLIDSITIGAFLLVSLWVNWQFTVATVIFAALVMYCFKSIAERSRALSRTMSGQYADLHSMLVQTLHAFKYLKATYAFGTLLSRLLKTVGEISRQQYRIQRYGAVVSALAEPLVVSFVLLLMLWQALVRGQSLAPLVVSIMLFYRISQYILSLQREWQQFASFAGSVEAISAAGSTIRQEPLPAAATPLTEPFRLVEFSHVAFSFGAKDVLRDISFCIRRNDMVAFVGESGIGKTTLVDMLTGVLTPRSGMILVNGRPLHSIHPADWRRKIGYVTQEPVVFNDTVANNICLWSCDPAVPSCREKICDAARKAFCDGFINELPHGYDTVVGDRGIRLSAGQRQRLAIARELFKQPEILILDEATSALDSESELCIQNSIHDVKGTLTVILIAHRLSTVRHADYIYVLAEGTIVECGTFKELAAAEGSRFRRMCLLQNIAFPNQDR
ncbi:MAG: ABC transporter ATP-binding protein/permease [Desulfobacterota bacterium]|nr:ABC transporter ATP-binding protein/permease [Thermodesulfobacteriota bacterium]